MRISDWSSDVCSADLIGSAAELDLGIARKAGERITRRRIVYQPPPALKVGRRRRPGKPGGIPCGAGSAPGIWQVCRQCMADAFRSEEHTSELQSLMRISYAVFCLKKKTTTIRMNRDQY